MTIDYGELDVLFGDEPINMELDNNHILVPVIRKKNIIPKKESYISVTEEKIKIKKKPSRKPKLSDDDFLNRRRLINKMYSRKNREFHKKQYLEMLLYSEHLLESNTKLKNTITTLKIHITGLLNQVISKSKIFRNNSNTYKKMITGSRKLDSKYNNRR